MGTLFLRFWHFIRLTKIAKNAIFQFSTRFLKTFPSTHLRPQYLKKNPKPSSTRIYPKQPRWPTHGRAVALAKYDQCGGTVGTFTYRVSQQVWNTVIKYLWVKRATFFKNMYFYAYVTLMKEWQYFKIFIFRPLCIHVLWETVQYNAINQKIVPKKKSQVKPRRRGKARAEKPGNCTD